MDTDSNYMATFADRLEDIVRPELLVKFEAKAAVACMRQVERAHAGVVPPFRFLPVWGLTSYFRELTMLGSLLTHAVGRCPEGRSNIPRHTDDSNYVATFADRPKDIVRPELRAEGSMKVAWQK